MIELVYAPHDPHHGALDEVPDVVQAGVVGAGALWRLQLIVVKQHLDLTEGTEGCERGGVIVCVQGRGAPTAKVHEHAQRGTTPERGTLQQ